MALDVGASKEQTLAAFEAGYAESGMRNLNHGDRDSQGVLQQRPSQGWGSVEEVRNPERAFRKFFERALNVDDQPAHIVAQMVQKSHCTKNAPMNADCKGRWGGNYLDEHDRAQKTIDKLRTESAPPITKDTP